MLNRQQAEDQARTLLEVRREEKKRLDKIHEYVRNKQEIQWLKPGVPEEVRELAKIARVNVLELVVDSVVQSMYVDGFRAARASDNQPAWDIWQANRFDARQTGVHRAATTYGASYVSVLPGDPVPVLKAASPRKMTVLYGEDEDWPVWALEERGNNPDNKEAKLFRLIDEDHVYWLSVEGEDSARYLSTDAHGSGLVPVVRYLDEINLDDPVVGDVEPLFPLQDQINITTFALLVAQHYGAFRQRYVIGWLAKTEEEQLKASAAKLWTFEDSAEDVKVGEFEQTDVNGYIESRQSTMSYLATISQTPVHELIGTLINLSAEALVAAKDSATRKVTEKKIVQGESHEQTLTHAGRLQGVATEENAEVRWRDMEARSLAQAADALGKMAESLGIPRQALWERVPGVTDQELTRWKALDEQADKVGNFERFLDRQEEADGAVA